MTIHDNTHDNTHQYLNILYGIVSIVVYCYILLGIVTIIVRDWIADGVSVSCYMALKIKSQNQAI